jgi:DNA replication licensing factor MCM6
VAEHILKVHRCEDEAVKPPYSKEQMQRYIRFARSLNPKLTPESQAVLVDCYRRLRQGDTLGRSRTAYRITVRQLESMIRLSEALARLHCSDIIKPDYVREAFRLLRKSIIHVENDDVTFENEDDDNDDDDDDGGGDDGGDGMETEPIHHPGEYGADETQEPPSDEMETHEAETRKDDDDDDDEAAEKPPPKKRSKKEKKKTQITFEEYQAISSAIATYLRSLERDDDPDGEDDKDDKEKLSKSTYLTWEQVVDWYLEQIEGRIGDSLEELERMRKLTNLVIRRLIHSERILIVIGEPPKTKAEERQAKLMVHPNVVLS